MLARETDADVLAFAVVDRQASRVLQVSVVGPQGVGVAGLPVTVAPGGAPLVTAPCGRGCYRATDRTSARRITVRVSGHRLHALWRIELPPHATPAESIVRRAGAVWRGLRSLRWHEVLGSSERDVVTSEWRVTAPDRLAYRVRGGPSTVIVGGTRWDRFSSRTGWVETPQTSLGRQPQPFWVRVADARLLGRTTFRGRPVWSLTFFDPATPTWFHILVDTRTLHTLHIDMYATAHFMHDTYGAFDSAAPIAPPQHR